MLHLATFASHQINAVIEAINNTGYGLTFGLQTRLYTGPEILRNVLWPAIYTSTATRSARWSAASLLVGMAYPAPGQKQGVRFISTGFTQSGSKIHAIHGIISCHKRL